MPPFDIPPNNILGMQLRSAETVLMGHTVHALRREVGPFSHFLMHDAIYVEKTIREEHVHHAYRRASEDLGIQGVELRLRDWFTDHQAFQKEVLDVMPNYHSGYRPSLPRNIHLPRAAPCSERRWDIWGRLPK